MMVMNLQTLLGDVPVSQFVGEYFQRVPYSAAGLARSLCELGTSEALTAILAQESVDVFVCRRNEQRAGPLPRTSAEARRLTDEGYTLLVRHAERHDPRLAAVAAAFENDLAAAVNIHMYCTPGGQYGFGWHYDAEDVFIVQTTGCKEYSLRKNTVNPWPIEEALPADMRYEREIMPLMRCELAAGDWLYIPSGYWHMGESRETAISLAIGVMPHTAMDLLDFLRAEMVQSLFWRQRLPVVGSASPCSEEELQGQVAALLAQCGRELTKMFAEPGLARQLIEKLRQQSRSSQ